jgi:type VI secretion system protein ImpH
MATASGRTTTAVKPGGLAIGRSTAPTPAGEAPPSVARRLYDDGPLFNFFQAVRLLERLYPDREPVGYDGAVGREVARFRCHISHNFPPSQIYEIVADASGRGPTSMSVAFFGLTGPSGVLPRHYTDLLLRLQRDAKHAEKHALRDWFDLFTHRLLSLFYRSWEKYRFYLAYERRQFEQHPPDPFTHCLLSLCGLGMPTLRDRLRVAVPGAEPGRSEERTLAQVSDLAVLHYAGLFAKRPRTAEGLAEMLADYFQAPVEVRQFHGEWLLLDPADQSQLVSGGDGADSSSPYYRPDAAMTACHCSLGVDTVVGERIWDVQGKIRIRIGPLDYNQFVELLPYRGAVSESKAFFLLSHLTRLYVGPTLNFDVQLLLLPESVPECVLGDDDGAGSRLGWNTWLRSEPTGDCVEDAIFSGQEVFHVDAAG